MPRVLRLSDDSVTGWPRARGLTLPLAAGHPFEKLGVRTVTATPNAIGLRRWLGLTAGADIVHAEGPASVRAGSILATLPRLIGAPGRQHFAATGDGRPDRLKLVATGASRPGGGPLGWFTCRALRSADRVVAATRAEAARYAALGVAGDRIHVIPPSVPTAQNPPDPVAFRRSLGIPVSARLIMSAGRFDRSADRPSSIWAFDVIRYVRPDLHLVLFGDGPERARGERFSRTAAFDDYRIHFAGSLDDNAMLELADIIWVTDRHGGVREALEAMAAGRPVIAFATPELAEIIVDGVTGFLVPPGDRVRLAAVTNKLLDEPARCTMVGTAARGHVTATFSDSTMAAKWTALYDGLIASRG